MVFIMRPNIKYFSAYLTVKPILTDDTLNHFVIILKIISSQI